MSRQKILWLCYRVLPDFSHEFGIKKHVNSGWMTGMLHELEKREEVEIVLCFPIYDRNRLKDGECNGHIYYTYLCDMNAETYDEGMVARFEWILDKTRPDVIHIWGTEYPLTTAMLRACKNRGLPDRAVVHIQGLVSVYARHYMDGIPEEYRLLRSEDGIKIEDGKNSFEVQGKCEIESLKLTRHVMGRTDWDRACVEAVNPQVQYHFCEEILRDSFYRNAGKWKYDTCRKYSIFVSQAYYPVKGFHYLLQALPIIISRYPKTHVYVAGTDILNEKNKYPYALYLEELIRQSELGDYISFLGRMDEEAMVEQYKNANVFVLPSNIENSPNSLSEAMIVGTPSIASFVGGNANKIAFDVDGFLYPHNEPALLAFYVCQIFENKNDLCTRLSYNSVKKMTTLIDPETSGDRVVQIYKAISDSSNM